ncbi:MAG: hypothetical protein ACRC20_12265 [Segniliparus sp.]|uniref:hypothetical protein n=1 Tax=Segniliparus sp. TaxID=2804064 RepID=UPI003F2AD524
MSVDVTLLAALGVAVPSTLSVLLKFARDLYALRTMRQLIADCDTAQRATISTQLVKTLHGAPGRELATELLKKRNPTTET